MSFASPFYPRQNQQIQYMNQPITQTRGVIIQQNIRQNTPQYQHQIPGHPRYAIPQQNLREERKIVTPQGQFKNQEQTRVQNNLQQTQNRQDSRLGLRNLGSTCYLNAVIQALQANEECMRMIGNFYHDKFFSVFQPDLLTYWFLILFNCQKNNDPSINQYVVDFKRILNQKYQSIKPYGQQDAEECLSAILDVMHEELTLNSGQNIKPSKSGENIKENIKTQKKADNIMKKFEDYKVSQKWSVLYELYGCCQLQKILCLKCKYQLDSFMTTPIIPLQMNGSDKTIQQLIKSNFKPESLKDYVCDDCKTPGKVQKEIFLFELPNVMIFHLKRYQELGFFAKMFSGPYEKNSDEIQIDEIINLQPFLSAESQNSTGQQQFKLSSLILHTGSKDSGHYTSIAKIGETWTLFNDSIVTPLNHNYIKDFLKKNSKAYILMYKRI